MASQRQIDANRANRKRWPGHTPDGIERLREAAKRNKPWSKATGPRTKQGKNRSKMNALKHGGYSAPVKAARKRMAEQMKLIRQILSEAG